jgi:diguanylate cyclase (GGDEF)-like protein
VAERTLEEVAEIAGVDAAILEATAPNGELSATVGFADDDASRTVISLPENENLRAVEVRYRYRVDPVEPTIPVVRSAVVLPVRADGTEVGTLSAFSRTPGKALDDKVIDELERLARRAGPALDNARRFAEARSLADLDALTGLHNHRYFHETLAREVARSHRYRRSLALLVLDLDDFKLINDRIGHLGGDGVLAELASRVRTVVRTSDVACRIGGDEFGVIMPEAAREDAEGLGARIVTAIAGRPVGKAGTVGASTGVAELQPDETAAELFERADAALYRSKERTKAARSAVDGA